MKLVNHLILRITLFFAVVMLFWSAIYFFLQLKEIHDGNDEGLINLKQEFIVKSNQIPGFIENLENNAPLNITVKEIPFEEAETFIENFISTKVYFATELEEEEVRMLVTAFRCELTGKYYRLQFFTSTVESDDLIKNMLYLLLCLWITLSLTIFIVSKIIISKANKPFYQLLNELKKFRLDNRQTVDFPETNVKEYVQLNKSVKELLEKNVNVFNEQKIFIENTAHELQTPLAITIAKLEMMMEKYQNDKEYTKNISAILNILFRMKRLNSNLLLLSKIKNSQFHNISAVDMRKVLNSVIEEFEDLANYKEISIEQHGEFSPKVQMNEDLAYILFGNLIKNAIAHNHQNGKVIIKYAADSITVANSGNEAVIDVFDRYRNAATDKKSSGLGLSIVKSISDLYHLNITYSYDKIHIFKINTKQTD
ncbi:MAG: HAMP domain-containing histidine kinase [Prevotellaceae bacterium]|jgi:signal transduction histidine kinase|nr:HAMP domain-containing histidine kinase [Prevotellaceae bacterium]